MSPHGWACTFDDGYAPPAHVSDRATGVSWRTSTLAIASSSTVTFRPARTCALRTPRSVDRHATSRRVIDVAVERRDDAIAVRYRQRIAGTEIRRHVDNQQGRAIDRVCTCIHKGPARSPLIERAFSHDRIAGGDRIEFRFHASTPFTARTAHGDDLTTASATLSVAIWNVGPCLCVPMTMRSIALSAAERAKRGGE